MSIAYQKYEFCKAMDCSFHYPKNKFEKENCSIPLTLTCPYSAKTFHRWLKKEGFIIFKAANKNEMVLPFTLKTNMGK